MASRLHSTLISGHIAFYLHVRLIDVIDDILRLSNSITYLVVDEDRHYATIFTVFSHKHIALHLVLSVANMLHIPYSDNLPFRILMRRREKTLRHHILYLCYFIILCI